jgi:hypothetical protein
VPPSSAPDSLDRLVKESPLCRMPFPHGDVAAALKEPLLKRSRLRSMVFLSSTVSQVMSSGSVAARTSWKSDGYSDCSRCRGIMRFCSPFDVVGFITFHILLYMILHCSKQMILRTADAFFSDAFFVWRLVSAWYCARRLL